MSIRTLSTSTASHCACDCKLSRRTNTFTVTSAILREDNDLLLDDGVDVLLAFKESPLSKPRMPDTPFFLAFPKLIKRFLNSNGQREGYKYKRLHV